MACWDMRFQLPISSHCHPSRARIRRLSMHPLYQSWVIAGKVWDWHSGWDLYYMLLLRLGLLEFLFYIWTTCLILLSCDAAHHYVLSSELGPSTVITTPFLSSTISHLSLFLSSSCVPYFLLINCQHLPRSIRRDVAPLQLLFFLTRICVSHMLLLPVTGHSVCWCGCLNWMSFYCV